MHRSSEIPPRSRNLKQRKAWQFWWEERSVILELWKCGVQVCHPMDSFGGVRRRHDYASCRVGWRRFTTRMVAAAAVSLPKTRYFQLDRLFTIVFIIFHRHPSIYFHFLRCSRWSSSSRVRKSAIANSIGVAASQRFDISCVLHEEFVIWFLHAVIAQVETHSLASNVQ